jgi:hypothetical protein
MPSLPTDRRFVNVRGTDGQMYVVDTQSNVRYQITGEGQLSVATTLYGDILDGYDLSGYQSGPSFVQALGGPQAPEQVVAGQIPNPLTGMFVYDDPTDLLGTAQSATSTTGDVYNPNAPDAPDQPSDAFAQIEQILRSIDLEALIPFAKEQIQQGVSADQFLVNLREQDAFRVRFGVIFDLEGQGRQLVPGGGLTDQVRAVLQYENTAKEIMEDLPPRFYDTPDDIQKFIAAGISIDELAQRVDQGFAAVRDAPPEVRQAFAEFFGVSGDAALASYFLDPDVAETALLEQIRTAEISGAGAMFGFDVDRQQAERLGDFGFGFGQATQGFSRAARLRPLASELTFERDNLTEQDLIGSQFGTDPLAAERVRRRQEARVAPFEGGGAGSFSEQGALGGGSA